MTADIGRVSPYYRRERSGIPYQLNPEAPGLPAMVRSLRARTPHTPCDPDLVAADLRALPDLMREMHFGIATGIVPPHVVETANTHIADAIARILHDRPNTWGAALNDFCDGMRLTLHDRHFSIAGAPWSQIRKTEPTFHDPGPAVTIESVADVLTIRVRTLVATEENTELLESWVAHASDHFRADRVILDLRGNTGGDDGYTFDWLMATEPEGELGIASETWMVGGAALNLWNSSVVAELAEGASSRHLRARHCPHPDDILQLEREGDADAPHSEKTSSWGGQMLVVTDARTGSSGESSAWFLRELLDARIVGGASAGSIEYGNICAYPLPGGMWVNLATKRNRFRVPVEVVGVQPDLLLDVTTPLTTIAENFDAIYRAAGGPQ